MIYLTGTLGRQVRRTHDTGDSKQLIKDVALPSLLKFYWISRSDCFILYLFSHSADQTPDSRCDAEGIFRSSQRSLLTEGAMAGD